VRDSSRLVLGPGTYTTDEWDEALKCLALFADSDSQAKTWVELELGWQVQAKRLDRWTFERLSK
jgi:hypothetical protein